MTEHLGVSNYLIRKLNKEHNFNFKLRKNHPEFKALYQDYDWCYQKYMIEGLNHDEMANEANCTKRVIEKWCTEKHRLTQKFRQKNKQLSDVQKDLLIGSLLGDGHIDRREAQPIFIVAHAKDQKDYLYWKYEILKDFCNIPPSKIEGSVKYFSNDCNGFLTQDSYRMSTRVHDCLIPYREMNINNLFKLLNKLSLSVWMLDDGHRDSSNWTVCVARFTEEEKEYAIKILKEKFNIRAELKKDVRYMYINATDTRVIDEAILNNIPSELDVVKYKITENKSISAPLERLYITTNEGRVLFHQHCKDNNIPYKLAYKEMRDSLELMVYEQ